MPVKRITAFAFFLFLLIHPKVAFAAPKAIFTDPATGFEIWQMTNGTLYESPDYYTSPLFSPNGKYFVYHDSNASPSYISIMNADGSNRRTLGTFADQSGGASAFGWWSNDSKYYYSTAGLYRINSDTAVSEQIPNASSCLPFNYPMVSPDGKVLSGVTNSSDTSDQGVLKLINVDGTNCRTFNAPIQPTGTGFDVTHGWVGNNNIWYLNDSVNSQYRDIERVTDLNGNYLGTLNAVDPNGTSWDGIFDHPQVSNEGYMVGGKTGLISGFGSSSTIGAGGWGRANTSIVATTSDIAAKEFTGVVDSGKYPAFGDVFGEQENFSPDGKWLITYNITGNCSTLAVYPVDKSDSPVWLAAFGPASLCEMPSGYGSYATFSPDSTKVIFASMYQLPDRNTQKASGKPDVYIAVFKKPDAPAELNAINNSGNVTLAWKPAFSHHEIKEYQIYASSSENGTYQLLSTVAEKYTYLNNASKIGSTETTITVDDTSQFPSQGVIEIGGLSSERSSEFVSYTGKTATSFTGCSRGYGGTTAAEHYNDAFVWVYTGKNGYVDQNVTANRWYKVKSVEWSGLNSELTTPITFSDTGPNPSILPTVSLTPAPTCQADLNKDSTVNLADITQILGKWGQACSGCTQDLNNDGMVSLADLSFILQYWGQKCQ
jgi:hypothetical protein